MAPPVQAKTLSLAAYIILTMVTFCVIVVLIIADTASGVVQAAISPLRQTIKPVGESTYCLVCSRYRANPV